MTRPASRIEITEEPMSKEKKIRKAIKTVVKLAEEMCALDTDAKAEWQAVTRRAADLRVTIDRLVPKPEPRSETRLDTGTCIGCGKSWPGGAPDGTNAVVTQPALCTSCYNFGLRVDEKGNRLVIPQHLQKVFSHQGGTDAITIGNNK